MMLGAPLGDVAARARVGFLPEHFRFHDCLTARELLRKLRALAIVAPQRSTALPDVPTVAEAGLKDFEVTTWYGILAPAGTPQPVVRRVNAELVKVMHAPEMKEKLTATGTEPLTSTPEEFPAYIKREIVKWRDVIRRAGVKAD